MTAMLKQRPAPDSGSPPSKAIPVVPTDPGAYPRIRELMANVHPRKYPLSVEKAGLVLESFKQTEGLPQILRRAKAIAHFLDHKTIFIEKNELIVGNPASKPMGMEAGSLTPTWPENELALLREETFDISDADVVKLRQLDDYWIGKGRLLPERLSLLYDDERIWPFIQSGILLPPWKNKHEGRGYGSAEGAWGLGLGLTLIVVDFAKALDHGLEHIVAEAEMKLASLRYIDRDSVKQAHFLEAVIIANKAVIRVAQRYSALAAELAAKEPDAKRRKELEQIAEICARVPGQPARNLREAMQSFWFLWLMVAGGAAAGGRFDQFMYPFYRQDREAGNISDVEVVELLAALRVKVMQVNFVAGGKVQREKWAGMARWNNWVIGGVDANGEDASNELSYLLLDAAKICPTPHYTLTLRVHDKTPDELMIRALEVVKMGLGMPAFVGDRSYIDYLTGEGVPLREARDYALGGCLDAMLPGKSRTSAIGMFVVPLVLELAINNGVLPRTGRQLGPKTGEFESFASFDDFMRAFKEQLAHFMALTSEEHNILLCAQSEMFPDAMHSTLMDDAIGVARDVLDRTLPFENGSVLNPVGMVNVADSMAALKMLVFEQEKISRATIKEALAANWQGFETIRELCLAAPKFGNGLPYVDSIAADLYRFWADTAHTFSSAWGGRVKCSGISITAYGPGGELTGATPDGRLAGENLADGTVSAAQGLDVRGPTALVRSGMSIAQTPYQSTLFNLKFHPSAMKSREDLRKVSQLVKTYFTEGGKHVQFNVVDRPTLLDAQAHPEKHRNLIVRIAGYSAYFVQLTKKIQNDIIGRTELNAQ